MTSKPAPGSVVAWWNEGRLQCAVVFGEEKRKIRMFVAGGREVRVQSSRIAVEIERGAAPGDGPDERREAGERAEAMAARVRERAAACDVPLVWELVSEKPETYTIEDLCDVAFGVVDGTERAAVVQALADDGVRFVRKGDDWEPRDAEAVERILLQRRRDEERSAARGAFLETARAAIEGRDFSPVRDKEGRRYVAALRDLAIFDEDARDASRTTCRDVLRSLRIGHERPHEGAFRLLRALGEFESDDENLEILRYGIRREFAAETLEQAERAAAAGFDPGGRADLTGAEMITIDSPHTAEVDDGLTLERREGSGCRLGIHIADPGAFVEPDDPVDREALARAISHYLPDAHLPMLPPAISEEAASLVEGRERPAVSFLVDLDGDGSVASYEVLLSVVRATGRLSYEEADRRIDEADGPFSSLLTGLRAATEACERRRVEAGAVRIATAEIDVHVKDGRAHLERHRADSVARRLVSEAMILAGRIAARFCAERRVPALFRRQAPPERPVPVPPDGRWDPVSAHAARRSMRRAEVGLEPGPHHALGVEAYAQATSPLRRFQDLATHRQIAAVLRGGPPCYDTPTLQRIAATTEKAEIESRRAERASDRYWLLRYLQQQEVEEVAAMVVAVEPRTVVQLEETLIEQSVPALSGAEPGERVVLGVERINPRADLLVLRPANAR